MDLIAYFTHANLKDENQKPLMIGIAKQLLFSFYFSQHHQCTHLIANGGAIVPVLERPEQVAQVVFGKPLENKEGENNGKS